MISHTYYGCQIVDSIYFNSNKYSILSHQFGPMQKSLTYVLKELKL